jgi:hypothetical protein
MKKSVLVGLAILAASTSAASAWTHQSHRIHHASAYRANRAAQSEAMNNGAYNNGYYGPGYARSGFWPGDAAGAAVGTAGTIAAGAVNTAGAIATAPFRPTTYGYYPANSYAMAPGADFNSSDRAQHMKNLRDSGYDPKNDFDAAGNVKNQ